MKRLNLSLGLTALLGLAACNDNPQPTQATTEAVAKTEAKKTDEVKVPEPEPMPVFTAATDLKVNYAGFDHTGTIPLGCNPMLFRTDLTKDGRNKCIPLTADEQIAAQKAQWLKDHPTPAPTPAPATAAKPAVPPPTGLTDAQFWVLVGLGSAVALLLLALLLRGTLGSRRDPSVTHHATEPTPQPPLHRETAREIVYAGPLARREEPRPTARVTQQPAPPARALSGAIAPPPPAQEPREVHVILVVAGEALQQPDRGVTSDPPETIPGAPADIHGPRRDATQPSDQSTNTGDTIEPAVVVPQAPARSGQDNGTPTGTPTPAGA